MNLTKNQKIIIAVVAALILASIFIIILGTKPSKPNIKQVKLTMWGIEPFDAYRDLITDYRRVSPFVEINYVYIQKKVDNYEKELVDALASGKGPDIFMAHNTWLPKHQNKLFPLPDSKLPFNSFQSIFPEIVEADFSRDLKIYALPLSIDTLALYYNKDHFNAAGIVFPPLTWSEFEDDVRKLVRFNNLGQIEVSGAALGTSKNVDRFSDILSLLMMQYGTRLFDPANNTVLFNRALSGQLDNRSVGERALEFYTKFSRPGSPYYNWNEEAHYSIDAFSEGRADMMLNYSYQIPVIKSKFPYLNFGISFAPQVLADWPAHYANYWGWGVSSSSKNSDEAWKFILYLATNNQAAEKYFALNKKPPASRKLIEKYKDDPVFGIFCRQALLAKSWHQVDNLAIENIFDNMVKSVLGGNDTIQGAVNKAAGQIELLARSRR